jgi:hypothetical protein
MSWSTRRGRASHLIVLVAMVIEMPRTVGPFSALLMRLTRVTRHALIATTTATAATTTTAATPWLAVFSKRTIVALRAVVRVTILRTAFLRTAFAARTLSTRMEVAMLAAIAGALRALCRRRIATTVARFAGEHRHAFSGDHFGFGGGRHRRPRRWRFIALFVAFRSVFIVFEPIGELVVIVTRHVGLGDGSTDGGGCLRRGFGCGLYASGECCLERVDEILFSEPTAVLDIMLTC